jgi:protein-L-isoaspartate(D-aspartate) O-methyltransferase
MAAVMIDLAACRRFYAEEIGAISNLQSSALVEAFALVARERFLPPGPWTVRSESDFGRPLRQTADADPRRIYHNIAVGIDVERQLFNGSPGLLGMCIDALRLAAGSRVLHIGCGSGHYTAVIAHCVGESGRVLAVEVDPGLAAAAEENLSSMRHVEVRQGNGSAPVDESFDAVLVNAGATHPLETWLDALSPGGRMVMPLTVTASPTIGKGPIVACQVRRRSGPLRRGGARLRGNLSLAD